MLSSSRAEVAVNVSSTSPVAGLIDCRLMDASPGRALAGGGPLQRALLPTQMLSRDWRARNETSEGAARSEVSAAQALGVDIQQPMHLAHRVFGGPAIVQRPEVLEDRFLRLPRFLLLDRLVNGVVLAAPLRAHAIVLDERTADGAGDLDDLFLQQRRRAERGAPRPLVGQLLEEGDDRRHLGHGDDAIVRLARIAEIVANPTEELVVVRGRADLAAQEAEVLDQEMTRAVLVPPHLLAAQRAGGEPLGVFGAAERILGEQLCGQRVEPLLGRHGGLDYSEAVAAPGAALGGGRRRCVAASNACARRSRVGSLHARPRNVSPIGVPSWA